MMASIIGNNILLKALKNFNTIICFKLFASIFVINITRDIVQSFLTFIYVTVSICSQTVIFESAVNHLVCLMQSLSRGPNLSTRHIRRL